MAQAKDDWGSVRALPSGGYQARYRHAGTAVTAPATFDSTEEARGFLTSMRAALERGGWSTASVVGISVQDYSARWLAEHPDLRPRTRDLYRSELKLHILPALGEFDIGAVEPDDVDAWYQALMDKGHPGRPTIAKCYRLLHAIFATAVAGQLVVHNPCSIKGGGREQAPERPVATIAEVFQLANAIDPRFRAAVLLATFGSLRIGEVLALRRRSFGAQVDTGGEARPPSAAGGDPKPFEVAVVEQLLELDDGSLILGPPKTRAGVRTVALPGAIRPDIERHLRRYAPLDPVAFVFANGAGGPVRRTNFFGAWDEARRATSLGHLHFHDLRHTGNTLAADTGASIKALMARMGHASARAALSYQHAARGQDRAIADALDDMIRSAWTSSSVTRKAG